MKYKILTIILTLSLVSVLFIHQDEVRAYKNYVKTSTEYIEKQAEYIEQLESMVDYQSYIIEQQCKELGNK